MQLVNHVAKDMFINGIIQEIIPTKRLHCQTIIATTAVNYFVKIDCYWHKITTINRI